MPNALTFETYMMDGILCGDFTPANEDSWYDLTNDFHDLLDDLHSGQLSIQSMVKHLKEFVKKEPYFLDAYAHLGLYFADINKSQSNKWYIDGVEKVKSLIPQDFSGNILWGVLENRPFLRCHHGYILSLFKKSKFGLAAIEIEQHLAWNPDDNIGVRYLLGDAYMLAKQYDKAAIVFEEYMDEHPAYCYSLGLIHFKKNDFAKAITCFRKGILSNIYLAEILIGKLSLVPKHYWHETFNASPESSIEYMQFIGLDIWKKEEKAICFLDWLQDTSFVLAERALYVQQLEALLVEQNISKRRTLGKKQDSIWNNITDKTSASLVHKVTTHQDGECWPWETTGWM